MAVIIANANGDWWQHTGGSALYVLDINKITDTQALLELAEYANVDIDYDANDKPIIPANIHKLINKTIMDADGLEDLIWEYGTQINITKQIEEVSGDPLTTCDDPANCDGACENNFCEARTLCEDAACDGECENYYCSERED